MEGAGSRLSLERDSGQLESLAMHRHGVPGLETRSSRRERIKAQQWLRLAAGAVEGSWRHEGREAWVEGGFLGEVAARGGVLSAYLHVAATDRPHKAGRCELQACRELSEDTTKHSGCASDRRRTRSGVQKIVSTS
jgi:hypothetical protein